MFGIPVGDTRYGSRCASLAHPALHRGEVMAKFVINKGYNDVKEVEADFFKEDGSYTVFIGGDQEQVYARKTGGIHMIENLSIGQ